MDRSLRPTSTNVWVIAVPFYSHLCRASELAECLAQNGLTITLLGAEHDVERFLSDRRRTVSTWNRQNFDIRFRTLESAELTAATGGKGKSGAWEPTVNAYMRILEETLAKDDLDGIPKPTFVIGDNMLLGLMDLFAAAHVDVPVCCFVTLSPSLTASAIYIRELESLGIFLMPPPDVTVDKQMQQALISLPGFRLTTFEVAMSTYYSSYAVTVFSDFVKRSQHVILLGFQELESRGCYELERLVRSHAAANNRTKVPQVWAVGPLFPLDLHNLEAEDRRQEDENMEACLQFLDSQPPSSVVYVAFGVEIGLTREQILELIQGLERSQQPFLCVLHPPEKAYRSGVEDPLSVIPAESRERIGSRGLFVEWAPQREVLAHPSTGAFMSHCGYGSVLEAASFGVPMLCWPWQYDQFLDCRLVVDELQTGLELFPTSIKLDLVSSEKVEQTINTLFHSDEGLAVRKRALDMKERARQSRGENGSSTRNIQALVATIKAELWSPESSTIQ
ncbi:hypothetical protein R1sor_009494 [Riccia sorocarpa]|uniref:Glycosyltransferase n=1 Tax=Riccia sorocarpa TaxID=122646 RepID=A0ABD3HV99_9MARC